MRYFLNILFLLLLAETLSAQNPPTPDNQADTLYVNARVCARHWCSGTIVSNLNFGIAQGFFHLQPDGCYLIDTTLELSNLNMAPSKNDDPLNGMEIIDLIKINKHILGLEPLSHLFNMIAADVNNSRSITTFDIVESRKMLIGVYDTFPDNYSWRFVDSSYVFLNPNNPFDAIFPETINPAPLNDTIQGEFNFWAIKTGDVDCSANPAFSAEPETRSITYLNLPDRLLQVGETVEIPVRFAELESWLGFQLGLQFDPAQLVLENVVPGDLPGWDAYTSAQPRPGLLNLLWFDIKPVQINPEKPLFTLRLRALEPVQLSQALKLARGSLRAEGFTGTSEGRNLQLQFVPTASKTIKIGVPQPNPTMAGAWLSVELPEPAELRLDIWDMQGHLVWHRNWMGAGGFQQIDLPETAFPQNGIYQWRVVAGATVRSGRLVKSK